jgi:hypothetical protein
LQRFTGAVRSYIPIIPQEYYSFCSDRIVCEPPGVRFYASSYERLDSGGFSLH